MSLDLNEELHLVGQVDQARALTGIPAPETRALDAVVESELALDGRVYQTDRDDDTQP